MMLDQTERACAQFKLIGPLFERLYINKIPHPVHKFASTGVCATYVVENEAGERIFAKTVNVITKEHMRSSINMVNLPDAQRALDLHYSNEYVASDGLMCSVDLCFDHSKYPEGALKAHPEYGQEVYHADLWDIDTRDGGYLNLMS